MLFARIRDRVESAFALAKGAVEAKGATQKSIIDETIELVGVLANLAQQTGGTGEEKRAAVLAAIGEWCDVAVPLIDVPYVPEAAEKMFFDPTVKRVVLFVADKAIDGIVALLKRSGALDAGPEGGAAV